jgi:hypothetical protein
MSEITRPVQRVSFRGCRTIDEALEHVSQFWDRVASGLLPLNY